VRSEGWGIGIDVGPEGPFARLLPFSLRSAQDAVDHYDSICRVLSGWPLQPAHETLQDVEGTHDDYAVKDPSLHEDWIYPSELEQGSSSVRGM